ncbi:aspartate racemase [Burkholderiales bacterium]|nr:aspartate racemase [Burkholderiales bacterium]
MPGRASAGSAPAFLLGVLGGMGPLATVDFLAKLVAATPADGDADHVPFVVASIPQVPSRVHAILADGDSPLPALADARDRLLAAGATILAMPCNTAHHWHAALAQGAGVPFLHIADAAVAEASAVVAAGGTVGIIATEATHAIGLYASRLEKAGFRVAVPADAEDVRAVAEGIAAVKRGDAAAGGRRFAHVVAALERAGAGAILLGCTEVPPGLEAAGIRPACPWIDPTAALARACVDAWSRSRVAGARP